MNRLIFALGGAAAVLVVAVVALGLYSNQPGIGGQPSPTPSPRPSPGALPASGSEVDTGWHFVLDRGYRYTFHVSNEGWTMFGTTALLKGDEQNAPPDFAGLGIWGDPQYANEEACLGGGIISTGETATDMATVLASLQGFTSSEPTNVTIDGYSGKRLQLTVPGDQYAGCVDAYNSFEGRNYQAAGQVDDIWILDLEDGDRALLFITYLPTTPKETVDELRQMIESLEIEAP